MEFPTVNEEDRFVAWYRDGLGDQDSLVDAIQRAMDEKRPMLAARLVQCLSDQVEIPAGSPLERASKAASFLIVQRPRPEDTAWSVFEDAWDNARAVRRVRARDRMRRALQGKSGRLNRMGRPKRR